MLSHSYTNLPSARPKNTIVSIGILEIPRKSELLLIVTLKLLPKYGKTIVSSKTRALNIDVYVEDPSSQPTAIYRANVSIGNRMYLKR